MAAAARRAGEAHGLEHVEVATPVGVGVVVTWVPKRGDGRAPDAAKVVAPARVLPGHVPLPLGRAVPPVALARPVAHAAGQDLRPRVAAPRLLVVTGRVVAVPRADGPRVVAVGLGARAGAAGPSTSELEVIEVLEASIAFEALHRAAKRAQVRSVFPGRSFFRLGKEVEC